MNHSISRKKVPEAPIRADAGEILEILSLLHPHRGLPQASEAICNSLFKQLSLQISYPSSVHDYLGSEVMLCTVDVSQFMGVFETCIYPYRRESGFRRKAVQYRSNRFYSSSPLYSILADRLPMDLLSSDTEALIRDTS